MILLFVNSAVPYMAIFMCFSPYKLLLAIFSQNLWEVTQIFKAENGNTRSVFYKVNFVILWIMWWEKGRKGKVD